jgi:hypothetical protein
MFTYSHTVPSTETFSLSLFSSAPAYPLQMPSLCRESCADTTFTKFNHLNDPDLTININRTTN